MPKKSETKYALWEIGDAQTRNEFSLLLEDTREGETYEQEVSRVRELLVIHVELMNSLNLTGAIHVCRACADLN